MRLEALMHETQHNVTFRVPLMILTRVSLRRPSTYRMDSSQLHCFSWAGGLMNYYGIHT